MKATIMAIAKKIKSINNKIIFHVDGVQAYGKIPYKISQDIDLYSISAHKINALKGVGALIKKKNVNLSPLIFGGGQENGYRSGTENVFGIKVFEYAGKEKYQNIRENYQKIKELRDQGYSVAAIAKMLNMSQSTVRIFLGLE